MPDIAHAPRILPNYTQNIPANLKKVQMYQFTLWMDVLCMYHTVGVRRVFFVTTHVHTLHHSDIIH